jgi:hypothetical protein
MRAVVAVTASIGCSLMRKLITEHDGDRYPSARAVQTGLPRASAAVFRKNTRDRPHVPPRRLSTFCLSAATRTSNPPAFITLWNSARRIAS